MNSLRADFKAVVVADDLTGAMDSAKAFASRGWAATVLCGAGAEPAALAAWLQRQPASQCPRALCVDTATRHWADDAAAARVAEVTRLVATAAPAAMHYKKIDSTFRGPWLEEVAAWRSALSEARGEPAQDVTPQVTLLPAWPREQRIVRGGLLFWRGLPLMDTPMAQDPLGPPRYPSATLTGRAAPGAWGLPPWASLPDCETEEQLHAVLAQAEQAGRWLAGSTAPLDRWCEQHIGPRLPPQPAGMQRLWLAMGSLHPASREQTSRLLASHHIERSFLTPPERQGRTVAERVAVSQALGREVAAALQAEPSWDGLCLLAAGGDTALAAAEALGIGELTVRHCGPFALGLGVASNGKTLSMVTKPGGFGGPDVWLEWVAALLTEK